MAIALLADFETEELPGVPYWRLFPKIDVSSYGEMWTAAQDVANNCISKFLPAPNNEAPSGLTFVSDTGWEAVGMVPSIL